MKQICFTKHLTIHSTLTNVKQLCDTKNLHSRIQDERAREAAELPEDDEADDDFSSVGSG